MTFNLKTEFQPCGDQPNAIKALSEGLIQSQPHQILLGVTGSGKTFTMANIIQNVQKPTLIIAHNKTLAAQLFTEFKAFFPDNAVEYFISYYDYYQPEAYIPSRDVYIEKESSINEEIERLRHSATRSLLSRKDVIIVASVSCIYGLGVREEYEKGIINIHVGMTISLRELLKKLTHVQYERNDLELKPGRFRVRGDTLDIFPSWSKSLCRVEFFDDEIDRITMLHPITHELESNIDAHAIFPATHYLVNHNLDHAIAAIKKECEKTVEDFKKQDLLFEAKRIHQRTYYDLEMIKEMGYCKGIENYARHISGRPAGSPPGVLLDFFKEDPIIFIDESHVTVPQIRGMQNGDLARKNNLITHGFRLPSAKDNRPLKFDEFTSKAKNCIYVSATPGEYELTQCKFNKKAQKNNLIVEQIIRPTGLVDPIVEIKPTKNQINDLIDEIKEKTKKKQRTLVTTLTKKMAEDLSDYFNKNKIKVNYLHSEISALDRVDILHDLRIGKYDVLIGVNLLREGLDLPEVGLVAIMDADKEGFLRNERSLIQTMGRAARNIDGKVLMYADQITDSMKSALNESKRRREIQLAYNKKHNITPKTVTKTIHKIRKEAKQSLSKLEKEKKSLTAKSLPKLIQKIEKEMNQAAKNLEFELAAVLRDQLEELKQTSLK